MMVGEGAREVVCDMDGECRDVARYNLVMVSAVR